MIKETNQKHILYAALAILAILILFLLIFAACGSGGTSAGSSNSKSVLLISIDYDAIESKTSDTIQVENALNSGGMIILNPDNMDSTFKDTVSAYGAADAEGSYYVMGALLNYVASRGWELIQAPSSGLSASYYFIK